MSTHALVSENATLYYKIYKGYFISAEKESNTWTVSFNGRTMYDYNLSKTLEFEGSGFFGKPSQWDYQVGDKVTAQLYSWVKDSTGEIVRREIHTIY